MAEGEVDDGDDALTETGKSGDGEAFLFLKEMLEKSGTGLKKERDLAGWFAAELLNFLDNKEEVGLEFKAMASKSLLFRNLRTFFFVSVNCIKSGSGAGWSNVIEKLRRRRNLET